MIKRSIACLLAALLYIPVAGAVEIGGPAPDLMLSTVVKGDPVKPSIKESGKITVVEFWATWCGPCRQSIPHLTELQAKYKDKNVRIIGISDESVDQVRPFVEGQGDNMAYTVAVDDNEKTWNAFTKSFGVDGIPHAFLVDASGTLLWHGHPLDGLDEILAQVVDGKYDVEAARKQAQASAMHDELSELTMLWAQEYLVLSKYGRDKEGAIQLGKKLLDCGYDDPVFYSQFAWTLLSNEGMEHQDLPYMLQVAEFANKLADGKSADVLDTLALALYRSGRVDEAIAAQNKAIQLCDNDDLMQQLKERLANYQKQ